MTIGTNSLHQRSDRSKLGFKVSATLATLAVIGMVMAYAPGVRQVSPIVTPEAATASNSSGTRFVYFPSQYQLNAPLQPDEVTPTF